MADTDERVPVLLREPWLPAVHLSDGYREGRTAVTRTLCGRKVRGAERLTMLALATLPVQRCRACTLRILGQAPIARPTTKEADGR